MLSGNTWSCGCYARQKKRESRLSDHHAEITAIILQYKRHAKNRCLSFTLTRKLISDLVRRDCFYCGICPSNLMRTKNSIDRLHYSGIDRLNNKKGYSKNNVVPACKLCNLAKRNLSLKEFHDWIKRLTDYQKAAAINTNKSLDQIYQLLARPEIIEILKHVDGTAINIEDMSKSAAEAMKQAPLIAKNIEKIASTTSKFTKITLITNILTTIARIFIP